MHSVASLGKVDGRACLAAEDGLADDLAGSVTRSNTAGLGAHSPFRDGSHFAVDGACSLAALLALVQCGALLAKEVGLLDNVAFAVAHATTTGASAGAPLAELGVNAVLGAFLSVAFLRLFEQRADRLAALVGDGTLAGHEAGAALLGAGAVVTPAGHGASDRARTSVALAVLIEEETTCKCAFLAAEGFAALHLAAPLLDAGLARNTALAPGSPRLHDAVDGALVIVAGTGHAEGWAGLAVVLGLGDDGTAARLEAGVAGSRASGPLVELANLTVNLARHGAASRLLLEVGALESSATVLDDSAAAGSLAHAAGLAA